MHLPTEDTMIHGKRIYLRAWERSDLVAFTRWFNDPEVTVNLGDAYPALSSIQEERFFEQAITEKHHYAIVLREGDLLIGNCSFHHLDLHNRSAELGIVIGEKAYWNQGYGREAVGMMLEIGFEGLGMNRIELRYYDFNARGRRAYEAAGFVEEGHLRCSHYVAGAFHDMVIMSVLADEYWARKRAAAPES
jgi:diamine N-acetyltransferase